LESMEKELILVLILGGLASLDSTEAFQSMWSQPLVSGPLIGWLWGDLKAGLLIGVLLQLLWLGYLPLGVAVFPDAGVGGIVGATAFLHLQDQVIFDFYKVTLLILLFSLIVSYFSGWLILKNRFWNVKLVHKVEKHLAQGRHKLNYYFCLALLVSFSRGALTALLGYLAVLFITELLAARLAVIPDSFFDFLLPSVYGFGLASLFFFFGKLKNSPFLLGGAVLGLVVVLV